jgi:hypothetical protein
MLFATCTGLYPGRALVDDAVSPSQCVVRIHHGTASLGGRVTDRFLADAVTALRTIGAVRLPVAEQDFATHDFPPACSRISNRLKFAAREKHRGYVEH